MKAFLQSFWRRHLRSFFTAYLADLAKGCLLLSGAALFHLLCRGLLAAGFDPAYVSALETVDFYYIYAIFLWLAMTFVGKMIMATFRGED